MTRWNRTRFAELLAAEHGGTLPVVFDHAFAYSDPERVHVLQRLEMPLLLHRALYSQKKTSNGICPL